MKSRLRNLLKRLQASCRSQEKKKKRWLLRSLQRNLKQTSLKLNRIVSLSLIFLLERQPNQHNLLLFLFRLIVIQYRKYKLPHCLPSQLFKRLLFLNRRFLYKHLSFHLFPLNSLSIMDSKLNHLFKDKHISLNIRTSLEEINSLEHTINLVSSQTSIILKTLKILKILSLSELLLPKTLVNREDTILI